MKAMDWRFLAMRHGYLLLLQRLSLAAIILGYLVGQGSLAFSESSPKKSSRPPEDVASSYQPGKRWPGTKDRKTHGIAPNAEYSAQVARLVRLVLRDEWRNPGMESGFVHLRNWEPNADHLFCEYELREYAIKILAAFRGKDTALKSIKLTLVTVSTQTDPSRPIEDVAPIFFFVPKEYTAVEYMDHIVTHTKRKSLSWRLEDRHNVSVSYYEQGGALECQVHLFQEPLQMPRRQSSDALKMKQKLYEDGIKRIKEQSERDKSRRKPGPN